MFDINNTKGGTFNGFDTFAEYEEGLEQAALNILANEKAELIHISDAELNKMADKINERRDNISFYSKVAAGAVAFIPAAILSFAIGAGIMSVLSSNPNPNQTEACTPSPEDVCEISNSLPPLDKDGNVSSGW